jgi:ATP-binding cassette, subfamily A (ABC1), member 3
MMFLSNFLSVGYSFNCGAYVTLPVLEREYNLKYALNVMGCRVLPYWLATFTFDFLLFAFTIIIFYLVVAIAKI